MLQQFFKTTGLLRLSAAALGLTVGAVELNAQALSGVDVWGTSDYGYLPCATLACSGAFGTWGTYTNGGAGASVAAGAAVGGPNHNLPVFSSAAYASGAYLPILHAYASGLEEVGTHPGFSSNCCYITSSSSLARGVQYYSYLGLVPQTYDITFYVDGVITAGTFGGVSGSLLVANGIPDAFGELPYGTNLANDNITFGVNGTFADSRTLSFTLNPGDNFYLVASLFAQVAPFGNGAADASNTWRADFTAGNVNDLSAAIQIAAPPSTVVPEPATVALMATGLFAIAIIRRRRSV